MAIGQRAPYIYWLIRESPQRCLSITALNTALIMSKIHAVTFEDLTRMGFEVDAHGRVKIYSESS